MLTAPPSFGQPTQETNDQIVQVVSGDPEMNIAIAKARATLDKFIATLKSPKSWQESFLIKGKFTVLGETEHIWIADIYYDGNAFHGVLTNEPTLPGLKFKQVVTVSRDDVSDWMYIANGKLVGGYTTRELRRRQSKEERESNDAARPYVIEDRS
jgi:uncharacterized protein YegJ (DUF2314 family)